MTNYNEDYQYNSCTSRGICSVNPRTSSLQEILVLYLCLASYYAQQLEGTSYKNKKIKNLILNTISIMVSNPEFSENDFEAIVSGFNTEIPKLINEYEKICKEKDEKPVYLKTPIKFDESANIINSIRLGQQEYLKKTQTMSESMRDLLRIIFVMAKSICINILDLESFNIEKGYTLILKLLNTLNNNHTEEELKEIILDTAKANNELLSLLAAAKAERYGIQRPKEVFYSTQKGKAILVVGSNIRELEIILEEFKEDDIGIYTHDEMILAHTYPKFEEYKNLKGQYGQGMENCLLDFATFPGPVILTRHSLYNVEHLYRGRLYTTDFAYSKGVIPIINYDFSKVREALDSTKGFKTGKICESEVVGFNFEETIKLIDEKIKSNNFSNIFIVGLNGYTKEEREYFETLFKIVPQNILIISLSICATRDNIICLNSCFDSFKMVELSKTIPERYNIKTTLFFPNCDRHTISKMIYIASLKKTDIFVGKCTPITLNPNLITTISKFFGVKELSTPKKDLNIILHEK
ncbi:hypothetical protein IKQ21_06535 [bacterium]|nr:hypothetical protein [bacterium]